MIKGFLNRSSLKQKAAQKCVAFFIIFFPLFLAASANVKMTETVNLKEVKQKTTELLLQKDRSQALIFLNSIIEKLIQQPGSNKDNLEQLYTYKENVLSVFLTQETQDAYEASASSLFQNSRISEKNILKCLQIESTNLYCRWQNLKYLNLKNSPQFLTAASAFVSDTANLPTFNLLAKTLNVKTNSDQVNTNIFEKTFPVLYSVFEFERALKVKNYSLSKDLLQNLSVTASDYPELTFMRAQLAKLSVETSDEERSDSLYKIYKKKCSTLSPELTRKYFYDINLCHREL